LLRKIVAVIILVPLAIIIVALAVANRQIVTVSFDPFGGDAPAASLSLPLFVLIMGLLIAGVVIGGVACWLGQGKWRGAARRFERDMAVLRGKLSAYEGLAGTQSSAPRAGEPPAPLRLRPPVR
jgi:uncharacterized integral membrane protein